MTAPQPSPGLGEFGLDLDKAREAVTELHQVHAQLVDLRNHAVDVARRPRTAHDSVSSEAFELLAQKAVGGPESLFYAITGAMEHVEALIAQMEVDMSVQQQNDEDAARDLTKT